MTIIQKKPGKKNNCRDKVIKHFMLKNKSWLKKFLVKINAIFGVMSNNSTSKETW